MTVKLLMSWDIIPEHEQDYFEFVIRDFLPGVQKIGFELSDAWATVYGDRPQILVGAVVPDMQTAQTTMNSTEWDNLYSQLREYVHNFSYKIVESSGGFQF